MLDSIAPVSVIDRPVMISHDPVPISNIVLEFAFIHSSICPSELALSVDLIEPKSALVFVEVYLVWSIVRNNDQTVVFHRYIKSFVSSCWRSYLLTCLFLNGIGVWDNSPFEHAHSLASRLFLHASYHS